ncbi:MAG: SDR family oxidoreductase [archaeon]|nr:SDR family oxidoreductase [archaeon]MCR4323975.1 SDR family oxidoreductase [Nanoarchaeota archaeon]
MKIIVIGAKGFLGRRIVSLLSRTNEVIGVGKEELDATNLEQVKKFISENKPDIVIDTVALTSSVACEKYPDLAEKLNYLTAKNIAGACKENNAKMVFISSTYLFDGIKGNYSEEDEPVAINEYGRTKIIAEKEIMNQLEDYLILRVDIMYGFNGYNFPNGVFGIILSREEIIIRDLKQQRTPVFVDDVARTIEFLSKKGEKGIFHLTGGDKISYFNFLKELEKAFREKTKISFLPPEGQAPVKIPNLSTLNNSKILKMGMKMHSLKEGMEELRKQVLEANLSQQP